MTSQAGDPAAHLPLLPETFWGVILRRGRYVLAIGLAALIFCTVGWKLAGPPADWGGVSLIAWHNLHFLSGLLLALLLVGVTAICSFLVHPDAPHMGLFCALTGMAGLSIRGGTAHLLIEHAQQTHSTPQVALGLAVECAQWGIILFIAEAFTRMLHDHLFANSQWITRSRPDVGKVLLRNSELPQGAGMSLAISRTLHTDKVKGWPAIPLAMASSLAIAVLLLFALMQSQAKGQVFLACFVAFLVSTIGAYMAFPRVPLWALLLVVPLTAAVGYLVGKDSVPPYPSHAGFFMMRALPIDYVTMGGSAVILGYYWALHWALHSALDEE